MSFKSEWRKLFFMFASLVVFLILNMLISPSTKRKLKEKKNDVIKKKLHNKKSYVQQGDMKSGKLLFYDRLFGKNLKSCATCHDGDKKFITKMKKYPLYDSYKRRLFFLNNRIIACINGALDGPLLKKDDSRVKDIEKFLRNMD